MMQSRQGTTVRNRFSNLLGNLLSVKDQRYFRLPRRISSSSNISSPIVAATILGAAQSIFIQDIQLYDSESMSDAHVFHNPTFDSLAPYAMPAIYSKGII